jgi:TPP-dependent pyruvate/acetoin dehydrogenase alpha subunit
MNENILVDKESTLIDTERKIRELFKQKKIRYMFHLSGGNEKELIEIFEQIKPDDWVFSTHRNHYHALLKGMEEEELINRVIRGESMHLFSKELKIFTSSIVGGVLPISVGVALGIKRDEMDNHVWTFVGDMCAEMGIFHECAKYAARNNLPITFVVEDNGYGIMKTDESWGLHNGKANIVRYKYNRIFPHAGSGDWVNFDDI